MEPSKSEAREFGPQPLEAVMTEHGWTSETLIQASSNRLNFKMLSKGKRGRRLPRRSQIKITEAINLLAKEKDLATQFRIADLFNYRGS